MKTTLLDTKTALQYLGNDANILRQVRLVFQNALPAQFKKLQQACVNNDVYQVEGIAHSIKSAAASCGAQAIRELALRIEHTAGEGALQELPHMIEALATSMTETFQAMQRENHLLENIDGE
ncbi:Hpt domain-containing protein [Desulfovibrio inopinatus]|uniref:Hpt domain-containing protein n=1 Tax=Desulfovibrio inopinatus TaxID=102109 RepID=UPI00041D56AA|nr:Hpt domain-containing protein [Desulfovibrio inopinatus]